MHHLLYLCLASKQYRLCVGAAATEAAIERCHALLGSAVILTREVEKREWLIHRMA